MTGFREQGVTMRFVSHSLDSVAGLWDEVLWLENGRIREFGPAAAVISEYHRWAAGAG